MKGEDNDDNSCLCEHLFTKANATPSPNNPTTWFLCRTVTEELKDQNSMLSGIA
jgi:hypothetical protein